MTPQIERIRSYIQDKNPEFDLQMSSDIIENRLIDSLQFVEFVMFIEEVSGCKLDMQNLNIEDFRTLNTIRSYIDQLSSGLEKAAV